MNIILLGAPGAGKGTQAEIVSRELGTPTISTGAILRQAVKDGTEAGSAAKRFMDAGALVPDEIVVAILKDRISEPDCQDGFILDGFPRNVPQAQVLEQMGVHIDKVIEIDVPFAVIEERLTGRRVCEGCGANYHAVNLPPKQEGVCDRCGEKLIIRKDDTPETVKERLAVYSEQTAPLKGYYAERGNLVMIDGTQGIADITGEILSILRQAV